jgi:hypothetical protein
MVPVTAGSSYFVTVGAGASGTSSCTGQLVEVTLFLVLHLLAHLLGRIAATGGGGGGSNELSSSTANIVAGGSGGGGTYNAGIGGLADQDKEMQVEQAFASYGAGGGGGGAELLG